MMHALSYIRSSINKLRRKASAALCTSVAAAAILSATAVPAYAFQEHAAPEGLYIHQLGHILFALSMAGLWRGIKTSRLWTSRAWRLIAAGAMVLMIWNCTVFTGHLLSPNAVQAIEGQGPAISRWITTVWNITRVDNIICVAAMLCFLAGLKRIERERNGTPQGQVQEK